MFLLVRTVNGIDAIHTHWYGNETWGSLYQKSIVKKRKHWYVEYWTAGNAFFDDEVSFQKLDVIFESEQVTDMLSFVEEHYPNDFERIKVSVLEQLNEFNDFLKFYDNRC